MKAYLVEMRDGLARCARVAWSLGCDEVVLIRSGEVPRRFLYSASQVAVTREDFLPDDALILETNARCTLAEVDWSRVSGVAVGGASYMFSRADQRSRQCARIDARRLCLIGDQALAIALHAWGQRVV